AAATSRSTGVSPVRAAHRRDAYATGGPACSARVSGVPYDDMSRSSRLRLSLLALAACAVVAALVFLPVRDWLQQFLAWVRGLGFWGGVLVAAVYIPATVLCVPGSLITLGA